MKAFLNDLNNKSLLVLGLGKEGLSTYRWLRNRFPEKVLGVADNNAEVKDKLRDDNFIRFHLGEHYLESIKQYDLVFKSPGISLKSYPCRDVEKITSQTDVFLRYYGRQTIGVTGTKGKSTTSSLIAHILNENGKKVVLLGNIGIPAFEKLREIDKNTIVVFELSAHQLEYVHHAPHVAVLLNIFPEHLDHFAGYEAYKRAKLNIARFLHRDDLLITSKKLATFFSALTGRVSFYDSGFSIEPQEVLLKGSHNLYNLRAAILATQPFGVQYKQALKAAAYFRPLPHRLEYVGQFGGVRFYNDSISTIPQSAVAALKAISGVDILILGGYDRGLDYSVLMKYLMKYPVKNLLFTGPAGKKMMTFFKNNGFVGSKLIDVDNLEQAFAVIKKVAVKNSVCLLSPAAASYDEFHNFEHRGDAFKNLASHFG